MKRTFFNDWDYKKHAKLVTGVYAVLYAIDMTVGYLIIKKILKTAGKKEQIKHNQA